MNRLEQIGACEVFLRERGIQKFRIRCHDRLVRPEVAPAELHRFLDHAMRKMVLRKFQEIGFHYVSLDLQGYRIESFSSDPKESEDHPA